MTLLEQLRSELPHVTHDRRVYYTEDLTEAARVAEQVRELNLRSIRYVLSLEKFETQPAPDHPKRAAYDLLVDALKQVAPRLAELPATERGRDESVTALADDD